VNLHRRQLHRKVNMNHTQLMLLMASVLLFAAIGHGRAETVRQNPGVISAAVDEYLRTQSMGQPGVMDYSIGAIDTRLPLPSCTTPEAFMAPGTRLWGKTHVGVRCTSPVSWTIYVPVMVRVNGPYLITSRAMTQGHTIQPADVTTTNGDLTQLPAGVVQDPALVIGRTVTASVGARQPLRIDLLRAPTVIQQGQNVKLVSRGKGFEVTADGKALAHGQLGQVIPVRSPSGQTVSGIARHGGIVEVNN
jgi:flagellar basal body P-ring formation protein FlgA